MTEPFGKYEVYFFQLYPAVLVNNGILSQPCSQVAVVGGALPMPTFSAWGVESAPRRPAAAAVARVAAAAAVARAAAAAAVAKMAREATSAAIC